MATILHFLPFLYLALSCLGFYLGGPYVGLGLLLLFVIHPGLDFFKTDFVPKKNVFAIKVSAFLMIPALLGFLAYALFSSLEYSYSQIEYWLLVLVSGVIMGSFGITLAHEFIHSKSKFGRGLGVFLLSLVNYSHFRIEHILLHHRFVATPLDPVSARKGQGFYSYMIPHIFGGYSRSWQLEQQRLRKHNGLLLSLIKNRMHHYLLVSLIFSLAIYSVSLHLLIFWWLQSFVAYFMLMVIDYLEHYGLQRKEIRPGQFENISPQHSWDTNYSLTNYVLFNLGYHANHHHKAHLDFSELQPTAGANQLPYGYASMFLLALIPPLYMKIMDPLLPE